MYGHHEHDSHLEAAPGSNPGQCSSEICGAAPDKMAARSARRARKNSILAKPAVEGFASGPHSFLAAADGGRVNLRTTGDGSSIKVRRLDVSASSAFSAEVGVPKRTSSKESSIFSKRRQLQRTEPAQRVHLRAHGDAFAEYHHVVGAIDQQSPERPASLKSHHEKMSFGIG